jgi:hypothetical protein
LRNFLNDPTLFLHFCDYLPFKENAALYVNKLESYQVWLNDIGWLILEKQEFLKCALFFHAFASYYLPVEKGYPLPLNKFGSPPPKSDLCQVWLKFTQCMVLEKLKM